MLVLIYKNNLDHLLNNILYALGFIGGLLGPFPTIISTTDGCFIVYSNFIITFALVNNIKEVE